MNNKIKILIFIQFIIYLCIGQKSECPDVFTIDDKNLTESTWFGTIHLNTNVQLHGIFVDLIFDRRVLNVGTYFYDVTTNDNIEFHIIDRNLKLKPREILNLGFYVRFNQNQRIPNVKDIRLNGQNICSNLKNIQNRNSIGLRNDFGDLIQSTTEETPIFSTRRTTIPTTTEPFKNTRSTTKSRYFIGDLAIITSKTTEVTTINVNNSFFKNENCGVIIKRPNPLIVNGDDSYPGRFPWHAAIYVSTVSELKYICGGSLISKNAVITAAHCVCLEKTNRPVNPENLLIYLGKYNLRKWTGPEQDVKVFDIYVHPNYEHDVFYSDIALVKLKTEAIFSDYIRPVCLWDFDNDLKLLISQIGFVPGWGYNEYGIVSEDLSYVKMPVVAHETCIWSNRDFFSRITSNSSYCAGFRNGSSVCNGDSGGGMTFYKNNKWYLRGIVSVSIALQNHFLCDPNHYAVFTDVANFINWIKNFS